MGNVQCSYLAKISFQLVLLTLLLQDLTTGVRPSPCSVVVLIAMRKRRYKDDIYMCEGCGLQIGINVRLFKHRDACSMYEQTTSR